MKTFDFFYFSCNVIKAIIVGFLLCYALPAIAEPPPPEAFNHSNGLVLTLSDKWLDPNAQNNMRKSNQIGTNKLSTEKPDPKDTNIGCGMDVTPLASSDSSFGNRVVGKCNFNYHY